MNLNSPASNLTFAQISKHWHHRSFKGQRRKIVTLNQWLEVFGRDRRLEVLWLDVKVRGEREIYLLARKVLELIRYHEIPLAKVIFNNEYLIRNLRSFEPYKTDLKSRIFR